MAQHIYLAANLHGLTCIKSTSLENAITIKDNHKHTIIIQYFQTDKTINLELYSNYGQGACGTYKSKNTAYSVAFVFKLIKNYGTYQAKFHFEKPKVAALELMTPKYNYISTKHVAEIIHLLVVDIVMNTNKNDLVSYKNGISHTYVRIATGTCNIVCSFQNKSNNITLNCKPCGWKCCHQAQPICTFHTKQQDYKYFISHADILIYAWIAFFLQHLNRKHDVHPPVLPHVYPRGMDTIANTSAC